MKSSNKLLVKVFSVVLSLMLLNLPVFATGRYKIITESDSYEGTSGSSRFYNYHEDSGGGGVFSIEGSNQLSLVIMRYNFENNSAALRGGAIKIDNPNATLIIGDSIQFSSNTTNADGGAISNFSASTVNVGINAYFKDNTADVAGAIYNFYNGVVTFDTGSQFIGNKALKNQGGAIYNDGSFTLGNGATFKENSSKQYGGAIAAVHGTFTIGEWVRFSSNTSTDDNGGAIYNGVNSLLTIGEKANFSYNTATKGKGGAIFNGGRMTIEKNSEIYNNEATLGGAIYNDSNATLTIGNWVHFSSNTSTEGNGGAIYNGENSLLTTIGEKAKFNYNTATGGNGGAIFNAGSMTIGKNLEVTNNEAILGGAIYNSSNAILTIGEDSLFSANTGGAIFNGGRMTIGKNSDINNNKAGIGGAIVNSGNLANLTIEDGVSFSSNTATANMGGAIANRSAQSIINAGKNVCFENNSVAGRGGAIYNSGIISFGTGAQFVKNKANSNGGAIYNGEASLFTIESGATFNGNSANQKGGAIYNSRVGTLNLIADTDNIEFTGNTANGKSSAIYDDGGTINLWVSKNADIFFNDRIESEDNSSVLNINKSSGTLPTTGKLILNEDMTGYTGTVNFYNGTIELGESGLLFSGDMVIFNSATIDMANGIVSEHNFNNLTISNNLKLVVDADLANGEIDTISATGFENEEGKITVNKINVLSDIDEYEEVELLFANDVLKNKVESVKKASSVLYDYKVVYNKETGFITFTNVGENKTINFGTAASAIAATAGGAATQSLVANQVFANMNGKTSSSKKASIDPSNLYVSAGDQVFDNSGKIERGLWLKPFVAQETVKIGDADVDNNLYGTLAGIDFPAGEDKQVSFYLGYAGSKQEIEDVKSNQTGYVLGATGMIMKDSWYAGLTANVMFNKASIDTDFGTDDVDMNMFSVAAKAGYNFNISDSFVLEPNLTLVYGVVNSQEYESAQGAQIDSQSINNISVEPQVKAKFEIGNGWQPYGLLGYSANLGSKPTVKAEGVELELDSIDGYVEYGAGVNKDFIGTVWSCYAQVTGRSGGRNGFAGNLGIKYKF